MQLRASLCALLLGIATACGGSSKPPEDASTAEPARAPQGGSEAGAQAAAASSAAAPARETSSSADAASKPAADAGKDKPATDAGPKPTRTPEDIVTAPDVVFLFSFNDSEPKEAAEKKCSESAGADAKKKNECMAAARKQFPADGHRFKQDDKGQWWWITVRQNGNRLVPLHKIPVEFVEPTETTVTLKPVGKDKGSAPMNPPSKVVVEVPNDYQIVFQDPKAGRLVFQAKVGIVTD